MREICTSGSAGEGEGNTPLYPELDEYFFKGFISVFYSIPCNILNVLYSPRRVFLLLDILWQLIVYDSLDCCVKNLHFDQY